MKYLKISTFMLIGVVSVGMLVMETALSYPDATEWGNVYQNSELLAKKINLGNVCITNKGNQPRKVFTQGRATILGIGAVIAPLVFKPKDTTVGINIIPYVMVRARSDGDKLPLYLIPEVQNLRQFDEFLSTCGKYYNQQLASKYLKYYPLVLLHVENQAHLKKLDKHLKGKNWTAFFWYQSASPNSMTTLRDLLKLVFENKQAKFLEGLPFDVQVELNDERQGANNPLKFCVGSGECQFSKLAPAAGQSPTTTISPTPNTPTDGETNCRHDALNAQIASAQQEINRLRGELQTKSGDVINLNAQLETAQVEQNTAESGLFTCQRQLNSYQQSLRGTESEMALLKQQLELAKSQLGSCQRSLQEKLGAATQQLETLTQENHKLNAHLTQTQQQWAEVKARLGEVPQPPGNHKLIIVSLSKQFAQGRNRQDHVIRESLIEAFADIKRAGNRVPFTLLTIQAGRLLNESLLTAKDVQSLPINGKNSIRSQVEDGLQFGATDLKPLDDLGLVDTLIYEQKVGQVLYLTDNTRMSDKPPNRQRGIPLAWHQDGIRLQVLTNKSNGCTVWKKRLGADDCTEWHDQARLKKALSQFLQ